MPRLTASDGVSLHYTDEGPRAGLPVLCLAGLTRSGGDFDYVVPHFPRVRWIRPDYRGRGASDRADPSSYTLTREARDALELLDHLEFARAAILGTSRGGLVAMVLALTHRHRLAGVCLNDVGPVIEAEGLAAIMTYLGRPPAARSLEAAAAERAGAMTGFTDVPEDRWRAEVARHYVETADGLALTYDPRLRDAVEEAGAAPEGTDPWPLFDALEGLPLALVRGANSDILSRATADEMQRRRPDMSRAEVPGRGHVPFLDEPAALDAIGAWLDTMSPDTRKGAP